jgi:hypothetical protein
MALQKQTMSEKQLRAWYEAVVVAARDGKIDVHDEGEKHVPPAEKPTLEQLQQAHADYEPGRETDHTRGQSLRHRLRHICGWKHR